MCLIMVVSPLKLDLYIADDMFITLTNVFIDTLKMKTVFNCSKKNTEMFCCERLGNHSRFQVVRLSKNSLSDPRRPVLIFFIYLR